MTAILLAILCFKIGHGTLGTIALIWGILVIIGNIIAAFAD